jgi:hypothetical protein
MSSYVYVRSEPTLWTVGFYQPNGRWEPDSDHGSAKEAAARVRWLNGGAYADAEAQTLVAVRDLVERWDADRSAFPDGAASVLDQIISIFVGDTGE